MIFSLPAAEPAPVIHHRVDASEDELRAVNDLARIFRLLNGVEPTIGVRPPDHRRLARVGSPKARPRLVLIPPPGIELQVDPELARGLRGDVPQQVVEAVAWERTGRRSMRIAGSDPDAAGWAVYRFLQEEAGILWLLPGPEGEHLPAGTQVSLPRRRVVESPFFVSRHFYFGGAGSAGEIEQEWLRRHGIRDRFEYNHNLTNIIHPEDYAQNPDWFPLIAGERAAPTGPGASRWQPNLEHPGVIARAATAARDFFLANPESLAFSIALNDTDRFGEYPERFGLDGPPWFDGQPDYSDLVFTFSNAVAERVASGFPDRFLGQLAYFWWIRPPSFKVHPNIIPYLAEDRSRGFDPAFLAREKYLLRGWSEAGTQLLGMWDYRYGYPFLVPRIFFRLQSSSLRLAAENRIRAFIAEMLPIWAFDAPKVWLDSQLVWNPFADPEALLERWFLAAYGKAAPAMRRFFAEAEQAWESQPGPSRWIKYYLDPQGARLFTPDRLERMQQALDEAAALAQGSSTGRVDLVQRAFRTSSLFIAFEGARTDYSHALSGRAPPSSIPNAAHAYLGLRSALGLALDQASGDPLIRRISLARYVFRESPEGRVRLDPDWGHRTGLDLAGFSTVLRPAQDASFQIDSSARSLHCHSVQALRFFAWSRVPDRDSEWGWSGRFRGQVSLGSRISLRIDWYDDQGRLIERSVADRLPPGKYLDPYPLQAVARPPREDLFAQLCLEVFYQEPGDWLEADGFHWARWPD